MEIKKKVTIHFSEEDVKEIIVDYLIRNGYKKVETYDVRFDIGHRLEGCGMMKHDVTVFNGAYVDYTDK